MDGDLEDYYAFASVPIVGEMAGWKGPESLEAAQVFLRKDWFRRECLAIYHQADRKVVGSFGLHESWAAKDAKYRQLVSVDFGFALHPDYWGMGLAAEAVRAVAAFVFKYMDVDMTTCDHFVENVQSKRVIEKCGFVYEREMTVYSEELGRGFDKVCYVMKR